MTGGSVHEHGRRGEPRRGRGFAENHLKLITIFADIRGFSNMVGVLDMGDIMRFLDQCYTVRTHAVCDDEGKFIADDVMAFFGAQNLLENSVENGVKAAIKTKTFMRERPRSREERGAQGGAQ